MTRKQNFIDSVIANQQTQGLLNLLVHPEEADPEQLEELQALYAHSLKRAELAWEYHVASETVAATWWEGNSTVDIPGIGTAPDPSKGEEVNMNVLLQLMAEMTGNIVPKMQFSLQKMTQTKADSFVHVFVEDLRKALVRK